MATGGSPGLPARVRSWTGIPSSLVVVLGVLTGGWGGVDTNMDSAFGQLPQHAAAAPATQPVPPAGLGRSGRWFTYDGRPVYFVGFDTQELACDPSVDFIAALDTFVRYRINKVRIWVYAYWRPDAFLHPWRYADGRFNLDEWNPAYWTRLREFLAAAQARRIVVEITVFAPNNIDDPSDWTRRSGAAWNSRWNTNGAFSANAGGHFSPQFFDLTLPETSTSGKTLQDYQQALLDKTVAEAGGFPNVYFEVANEFPVRNLSIDQVYPWQLHWARRLNARSPRLVSVHAHEYFGDHTRGIEYFWREPYIDVLDFHFTSREPDVISSVLHAAQARGKILQTNEGGDPYKDLDAAARGAWGLFLAGGYYAMYEDRSTRIGSEGWIAGARRLKALRDIAESVSFWELSPVDGAGRQYDSLISRGPAARWQVLAKPGSEYLAFFWGRAMEKGVRVALPPGRYTYEWRDARTAETTLKGSVSGGRGVEIASPALTSWDENAGVALVIRSRQ